MKIIRWFLSHFFLILLIVAVIYGYMFWGNLAGDNTPAGKALAYLSDEFVEVEEFIAAVKAKQAQLSDNGKAGEQLSASSGDDETAQAGSSITTPPVSISYSHNQKQVRRNSAGEVESQSEMQPAEPVAKQMVEQGRVAVSQSISAAAPSAAAGMAEKQDKFVSTEVARQLNNVDQRGEVINESLSSGDIRENWIKARKSFYQRKYELSEQSYRDVISTTTDNFDAYGELGNVYFNQGKREQAAMAYFEAASILVRKGQIQRAKSLMGLLRNLDKNRADDLQKLIDSTVS